MGSALLDTTPETKTAEAARLNLTSSPDGYATSPGDAGSAESLRSEVAERLAAHRNRRAQVQRQSIAETAPQAARAASGRTAQIAAAVAQRYANSQSYKAFLAAEAERAVQQARAAAEVAALNARALAAAQQSLLDALDESNEAPQTNAEATDLGKGMASAVPPSRPRKEAASAPELANSSRGSEDLSLWPDFEPITQRTHRHTPEPRANPKLPSAAKAGSGQSRAGATAEAVSLSDAFGSTPSDDLGHTEAGFTVRLYEDEASAAHVKRAPLPAKALRENRSIDRFDEDARALDEEIEFRHSPVFEEDPGPPQPIPGNLIQFPRQLVASRKARPRYAEGPLREDKPAEPEGQLRIFEVDPAQISTEAVVAEDTTPEPQWTSIWLDTPVDPVPAAAAYTEMPAEEAPVARQTGAPLADIASIGRRGFAAAVNGCIILAGLAAFAAVVATTTGHAAELTSTAGLHALLRATFAHAPDEPNPAGSILEAAGLIAAFFCLAYQALFFWFSEATPGMRVARIGLCTFDDNNPTRKAMRRRIVAILLSACPLGLGFIWAALDEEKLAWHDRVSQMYLRMY
jgi:uncharacterized RDD family membrane protein YckC